MIVFAYLYALYWRANLKNPGNAPILSEDMPLCKLLFFCIVYFNIFIVNRMNAQLADYLYLL